MTKKIKTFGILLFIIIGPITYGQTNKEKALEKGNAAIKLEDEGKFNEAIKLFEDAQKLDPDKLDYPYEIGFCYMQMKEYEKAIKIVEKLTSHKDVEDVVYQLLGNAYDYLGKQDKAIQTYEEGLKKFPNSGPLYLESGIIKEFNKEYEKALVYFEKGIELAPKFPSNYYRATKIYCSSTEEVWGMIYGEIFMNLERNSKRTAEISKLLFDTYKSEIKFSSDTSFSVSFSKNTSINISELQDPNKMKLPFGIGIYEPTLMMSMINEKSIDLNSLDRIRTNFVEIYFKNGNEKKYPNILFDYQNKVLKSKHLDAYNHWILMKGDEEAFRIWQSSNTEKWDSFVKWFTDNGLKVDNSNKFYSGQY